MDRKRMEEIANKRAPKRPRHLDTPDDQGVTGQDALMLLLGGQKTEQKIQSEPEVDKQPVVLYLHDDVNPAENNFTKYPNELHIVIKEHLSKEYEGILYIYMWRQSFGYRRNYCRTSYLEIVKNTLINSRKTAQRAVSNLVEKHFIARARHEDGTPNVKQQGALYRVFTPREIQNQETLEGFSFEDIPKEGVVCQTIPSEAIPKKTSDSKNSGSMATLGVVSLATGQSDHSRLDHNPPVPKTTPSQTTPSANPDSNKVLAKRSLSDHTQKVPPLKEDIIKDSLSPRDIISGFYKSIGQNRVAKTKRERAEKIIEELQTEEFSLEDIQFASEWSVENAKEDLYDFSIIKHTIGQAMAAKEKYQARRARRAEAERIADQKRAADEAEEQKRAEVEEYKESLDSEARAKLRDRALREIKSTDGIKEDFINDMLIAIKENEILKLEMAKAD